VQLQLASLLVGRPCYRLDNMIRMCACGLGPGSRWWVARTNHFNLYYKLRSVPRSILEHKSLQFAYRCSIERRSCCEVKVPSNVEILLAFSDHYSQHQISKIFCISIFVFRPFSCLSFLKRYPTCCLAFSCKMAKTKIWHDNKMRWIRITVWNGFDLLGLKVEQINYHLFLDKSNKHWNE